MPARRRSEVRASILLRDDDGAGLRGIQVIVVAPRADVVKGECPRLARRDAAAGVECGAEAVVGGLLGVDSVRRVECGRGPGVAVRAVLEADDVALLNGDRGGRVAVFGEGDDGRFRRYCLHHERVPGDDHLLLSFRCVESGHLERDIAFSILTALAPCRCRTLFREEKEPSGEDEGERDDGSHVLFYFTHAMQMLPDKYCAGIVLRKPPLRTVFSIAGTMSRS